MSFHFVHFPPYCDYFPIWPMVATLADSYCTLYLIKRILSSNGLTVSLEAWMREETMRPSSGGTRSKF